MESPSVPLVLDPGIATKMESESTSNLKPNLKTFPKFPLFPKEIRDMIWKAALLNPRERTRWVVIYSGEDAIKKHVMPCKHLISPLLLVNTESRQHARDFFHLRLPVHRVGQLDPKEVEHLEDFDDYLWEVLEMDDGEYNEYMHGEDYYPEEDPCPMVEPLDDDFSESMSRLGSRWYYGDPFPALHHKDYMSCRLREEVEDLIHSAIANDSANNQEGVLYLSPEHDKFFDGIDTSHHFCRDAYFKTLYDNEENVHAPDDDDQKWEEEQKWHHISAELPALACQQIAKLVRITEPEPVQTDEEAWAEPRAQYIKQKKAKVFTQQDGELFWEAKVFLNLQKFYRLNLGGTSRADSRENFMYELTDSSVKFPYQIEKFVKRSGVDGEVRFIRLVPKERAVSKKPVLVTA